VSAPFRLFRQRQERRREAERVYADVVRLARSPAFYTEMKVPDTLDGRFELLALHAALVFRRLFAGTAEERKLGQAVWDLMMTDLDHNLREMGVGDLGVGKKIKVMAKALLGRLRAYDTAIDSASEPALRDALRRNVWRGEDPGDAAVAALSDHLSGEVRRLAAAAFAELSPAAREAS